MSFTERVVTWTEEAEDQMNAAGATLLGIGEILGVGRALVLLEDLGIMAKITAEQIMDDATADATIDEVMRRDPANLSDGDFKALIQAMRSKRALFIEAEEKKANKKAGIEEVEDGDDEEAE